MNPRYCLKVLALFHFINPTKEIRISGGREVNLGSLQPLGLYAANSIFVGDYLMTEGQIEIILKLEGPSLPFSSKGSEGPFDCQS